MEIQTTQYTNEQSQGSAVSWRAIFAGATAAAVMSLILLLLGTGLGLAAVSPWADSGVSGSTFGLTTILWITITSLIASALGGYLAGRLRVRWVSTQLDEVYFRDTAHGFLAWAIATLVTASLLTSVISSIVSGAAQAGASVAGGAAAIANDASQQESNNSNSGTSELSYFVDTLFRKDANTASANDSVAATSNISPTGSSASQAEVARIYMKALATDVLPPEDIQYAGQVVAQTAGLNQQDAETRVTDTFSRLQTTLRDAETTARTTADKARKASAYGSLWLFISLLIGAFVASLTAVYGGRQRDL
jgi:hypothetical protein